MSMSNQDTSNNKPEVFPSIDGIAAVHEPKVVVYDSRSAGTVGIQPANFRSAYQERRPESGKLGADGLLGSSEAEKAEPTLEQKLLTAELKGYEKGKAEEKIASQNQIEETLSGFKELLSSLEQSVRENEKNLSSEAVKLSIQIAEKVIRKSLGKDPAALAASVASFLESANKTEPVCILCDKDSVQALKTQMTSLAQRLQITEWVVEEDHELQQGDLRVTFGPATVDARVNHRLERIEQALFRELGLESHEGNIQ
jgi:flagellar biosynthesis/type III secretory pathway protein FliH